MSENDQSDQGPLESPSPALAGLDLNLLMVFDMVMVERHVTRAASRLRITQPAVSHALGRLRTLFGDPLFNKESQGVVPTARALELWPAIHNSLQSLQQAIRPDAFDPRLTNKTYGLVLPDIFEPLLLPRLLEKFAGEAPGASLKFIPYNQYLTTQRLVRSEADFEIGPYPPRLSALESQLLFVDRFVVIGRKGNPALRGPMTLQHMCSLPHVVVNLTGQHDYVPEVDVTLSAAGLSRPVKVTVNHYTAVASTLLATDMISIMPRHVTLVPALRDQLAIVEVPMTMPECRVFLTWHRRNTSIASHDWLKGFLLDSFADLERELALP